jgi:predicted dehydrogenase
VHVRALKATGIAVEGLVGRNPERTQHKALRAGVPHAFTNFSEALAAIEPEIVAIATPPATHAELARLALDAGCHILCEKPFTLDADEADDLVQRSETANTVCYLGHEFRFAECAALVSHLLDTGVVGEPRLTALVAHNSLVADPDAPLSDWWLDPARGGGWLGASGSHAVDRIRQWFGELETISARTLITSARHNVADDGFNVTFTTVSGTHGLLQATAGAWGPGLCVQRIAGSAGTIWIEDDTGMGTIESARGRVFVADRSGTRLVDVPLGIALRPVPGLDSKYERNVLPYVRVYQSMLREITGADESVASVRPATFADGAVNMRVLDSIRASAAASGSVIRLAEAGPVPADG